MNRKWKWLFMAFVLPLLFVLAAGCGDDDNPSQPGDDDDDNDDFVATTESVLQTMDDVMGGLNTTAGECDPLSLFACDENEDALTWMSEVVLFSVFFGNPLSNFFGTWEDSSPDSGGAADVVQIDAGSPSGAMQLNLGDCVPVGGGKGAAIAGNFTLSVFTFALDEETGAFSADIEGSVNATDAGESITFDLSSTAVIDEEGELQEMDLSLTGAVCNLAYSLDLQLTDQSQMEMDGHFGSGSEQLNFSVVGDIEAEEGCVETTLWTGTDMATAEFYMNITVCDSEEDCVTGTVRIDGEDVGTLMADDCTAEETEVLLVVDGETISAEELFDSIESLFDQLTGLGLEGGLGAKRAPGNVSGLARVIVDNPALMILREAGVSF